MYVQIGWIVSFLTSVLDLHLATLITTSKGRSNRVKLAVEDDRYSRDEVMLLISTDWIYSTVLISGTMMDGWMDGWMDSYEA